MLALVLRSPCRTAVPPRPVWRPGPAAHRLLVLGALLVLIPVDLAEALRPGFVIWGRVIPTIARITCDTSGNACCGPDDQVPTVHCLHLLGCNIVTGRCEPCGAPNQVCCDGNYTNFSLRSYTGPLLDPDERVTSCDPNASCDARLAPDGNGWVGSRRCVGCGVRAGAACCPPDVRYALGRCSRDLVDGRRLVCNDPWAGAEGSCVRCGQGPGAPVCLSEGEPECDPGMVGWQGRCVYCGNPGQPPCDDGCDEYSAVLGRDGLCIAAGGPWQPCRKGRIPCTYRGTFCNAAKICEGCSNQGQRCCPDGTPCWNSVCQPAADGDRCTGCGFDGSPPCAVGEPCPYGGTVVGGRCRPCGKPGQACCRGETIVCEAPGRCRDGECRVPSSGGGGGGDGGWRTCSGRPYSYSTRTYAVWIEGADGCVAATGFTANDDAEARGCARTAYGDAVVEVPRQIYRGVACPATGCRNTWLTGRDVEGAVGCGEAIFRGCEVLDGLCP